MGNCLETRLLTASLECVDECEVTITAAEAIPVVYVSEPVHEVVTVVRAVSRLKCAVKRVISIAALIMCRILLGSIELGSRVSLDTVRLLPEGLTVEIACVICAGSL